MNFFKNIGELFRSRVGAYIFFLLSATAAAFLHSAKFTYAWIAEIYPLGEAFVPCLFCVIGLCAAVALCNLLLPDKIKTRAFRVIHLISCVLAGALFVFTAVLLFDLDKGFAPSALSRGFERLLYELPYLGAALLLALAVFFFPKIKASKKARICALALVLAAVLVAASVVAAPALKETALRAKHASAARKEGLIDSGLDYTESTAMIANPHMGYVSCGSATLHEDGMTPQTEMSNQGFVFYYVNLSRFSAGNEYRLGGEPQDEHDVKRGEPDVGGVDKPISRAALEAFEQSLEDLRGNGGSAIMRFVYDWAGNCGSEPADFDMLLTHMKQLCEVVSKFPDVVLGFEHALIGPWGEMHSSKYSYYEDPQYIKQTIDTYLDNTPESMLLLVRTPDILASYLGITRLKLARLAIKPGDRVYRLGIWNDGYMNSDGDLGTWADRGKEIKFLERQDHVPYGGEFGSAFNLLPNKACLPENAIPEMYRTGFSYTHGGTYKLGGRNDVWGYDMYTYGKQYEKRWFPDNSAFYGEDCYTFITAHIGYRLVLRQSLLPQSVQAGGVLSLRGKIENTGFANVLHAPRAQVLLVKGEEVHPFDVNLDAFDIKSCKTYLYAFELSLPPDMAAGEYDVYLRLSRIDAFPEATARSGIQFANNGGIFSAQMGANRLGSVVVA